MDEYERLTKAAEKLESVRGYALEMISAMGEDEKRANADNADGVPASEVSAESAQQNSEEDSESRAWYQRT